MKNLFIITLLSFFVLGGSFIDDAYAQNQKKSKKEKKQAKKEEKKWKGKMKDMDPLIFQALRTK